MGDITKVKLGSCSVNFDGTDLGHTKGGVEISYDPDFTDITVDLYGDTPVDKRLKAENFSVKIPLAEKTYNVLKAAIPSGTYFSTGGRNKLTIGKQAGFSLASVAKRLVLHPTENATTNKDDDVVMWSAVSIDEVSLPHKFDEQTIIEVTMMALINENMSAGNYLATIGDTTI